MFVHPTSPFAFESTLIIYPSWRFLHDNATKTVQKFTKYFITKKRNNQRIKMALWGSTEGDVAKYVHENSMHIASAEVGTAAALSKLTVGF